MNLEDLIVRDADQWNTDEVPPEIVVYEHTPVVEEVRAAYITQHAVEFFDNLGPRPEGVPQGPEHSEAEFKRFLRAVRDNPEMLDDYLKEDEA